mmetsp:Transcript_117793/g.313361  ORF Transcript_117793/g.313361 Transcript_117793/m.313361 type:complete len:365 (+) Transcript_117793:659-1753(+)
MVTTACATNPGAAAGRDPLRLPVSLALFALPGRLLSLLLGLLPLSPALFTRWLRLLRGWECRHLGRLLQHAILATCPSHLRQHQLQRLLLLLLLAEDLDLPLGFAGPHVLALLHLDVSACLLHDIAHRLTAPANHAPCVAVLDPEPQGRQVGRVLVAGPVALVLQHCAILFLCEGHLGEDQLQGPLLGFCTAEYLETSSALVHLDLCAGVPLEDLDGLALAAEHAPDLLGEDLEDARRVALPLAVLRGARVLEHLALILPAIGGELQQQVQRRLLLATRSDDVHVALLGGRVHLVLPLHLELCARPRFDVPHRPAASTDDLGAVGVGHPHADLCLLPELLGLPPPLPEGHRVGTGHAAPASRRP